MYGHVLMFSGLFALMQFEKTRACPTNRFAVTMTSPSETIAQSHQDIKDGEEGRFIILVDLPVVPKLEKKSEGVSLYGRGFATSLSLQKQTSISPT